MFAAGGFSSGVDTEAGEAVSFDLRDSEPHILYRGRRSRTKGIANMEVQLTDDQMIFVRQAIENGRYSREEDAIREALSLWESRERRRAEIIAAVDQAEASFAIGNGRRINTREEAARLAEDIKLRGIARLAAEKNSA